MKAAAFNNARLSNIAGLSLCLLFCCAAEEQPEKTPSIPKTVWYSDLGQAATDARDKNLPLLLLLELPDHAWSRQMLAAFDDEAVVKTFPQFVPVRLNVHLYSQLVDQLIVNTLPDLRVFTSDGRQLGRQSGLMAPEALATFLEESLKATPDAAAPTLSMLFPSSELDALISLEQRGKLPGGQSFSRLMEMASGRSGETRLEAQRLLQKWSHSLAPSLAEELAHITLKRRLAAFEILKSLEAPLGDFDPWAGPASPELVAALAPWAKKLSTEPVVEKNSDSKAGKSAFSRQQMEQIEAELRVLASGDETRAEIARQRLVAFGRALVPILRERARTVAVEHPAQAVRLDELRFRLLMNGDALRKQPGTTMRLVAGGAGSRANELQRVLRSGASDLADLAREAACDRDALFREMAIRNLAQVMDAPDSLYRDALRDSDPNVRTAALTAMAASGNKENAEALKTYLESETDTDMVCHAIKALAAAKTALSKQSLRKLLHDPRWQVRAAAAEQLGELSDADAVPDLVSQLETDDGFVAARVVEALSKIGDKTIVPALSKAVDKHPELTVPVLKALSKYSLRSASQTDALLRKFTTHATPQVRAEALAALASDQERPAFDEVSAGLKDEATVVRTAAVRGLRSLISRKNIRALLEKGKLPEAYTEVRPKILAMLDDADERLALQAALTLSYFGDTAPALPSLKKFVIHPNESMRNDTLDALAFIPAQSVIELLKLRLSNAPSEIQSAEWSNLLYELRVDRDSKDADWMPEPAYVEAYFLILPHVPADMLSRWYTSLYSLFGARPYDISKPPLFKKVNKALSEMLASRLPSVPAGPARDAAELLWLRVSGLEVEKLQPYLSDARTEVRRMAVVLQIRAAERGPDEMVPLWIKDPSPEIRRLGVAAAIPFTWRGHIEDPTAHDLVGGNEATLEDYQKSTSHNWDAKVPPVVQLPVETLEALLKDDDERVRAITAFLMAMEGGDHGIDILVKQWRRKSRSYERQRAGETLVGAIAMAWNDTHTPVIEQVYDELARENSEWEVQKLYRLIVPLSGDQIKKLRGRIRREFPNAR